MATADFRWLPVTALRIDHTYQRPLSEAKVRQLMRQFDIEKVGALCVSIRDGVYWIIDGQHRWEAARRLGIEALPCIIYSALSQDREADLRIAYNAKKPDSAREVFRLRLAAGEARAVEIQRIVQEVGLELSLTGGSTSPHRITCVGALDFVFQHSKGEMLRRVLHALCAAWPESYEGRVAALVRGVHTFLGKYPEVRDVEGVCRTCGATRTFDGRHHGADGVDLTEEGAAYYRKALWMHYQRERGQRRAVR